MYIKVFILFKKFRRFVKKCIQAEISQDFFFGGGGDGRVKVVNQIAGGVRVLVAEATKCSRFV